MGANERFTSDNTHLALATGDDSGGGSGLTAWRNADAAFIAGELQPTDQFIGGSFKFPKPKTQEVGALKATYIADRREAGREKGSLSLEFALQTAQFCWWLWQACTTSHSGAEVSTVKCIAASAMTTSDYFLINTINGAGAVVENYVWFQIDAAGADPAPGGTGIEVDILSGDDADGVATKLKTKMDAEGNYGAAVATDTVTITNANAGAVVDASDVNTDFTIGITTQGTDSHAITLNAAQTPIWHGFHIERETPSKNITRRVALMGFLPNELRIRCDPDVFTAIQTLGVDLAYYKPGVAEITPQTKRPSLTIGSIKKNWSHLVAGGLGENQTALTYNGTAVAVAIKGITIILSRKNRFGIPDQNNYPAAGFMQGAKFAFELDVEPYDSSTLVDLFALNDIKKSGLAGDIDFDFKFEAESTKDYIRLNADKLNMLPFDELAIRREDWFEGYTIILEPLDDGSSLTITGIDTVDKTGFENP